MSTKFICSACEKPIGEKAIFIEGFPYHQECIKCMIPQCSNGSDQDDLSNFVAIQTGLFFCRHHYNEYLISKHLPSIIEEQLKKNQVRSIIQKIFYPPPILQDSIVFDKPYKIFLPTVELKFDKEINDFNFESFQEFLGDKAIIVNAKIGSTDVEVSPFFKQLGTNISNIAEEQIKKSVNDYCEDLSRKLAEESTEGIKTGFGKLKKMIKNRNPNKKRIKEFLKLPCNKDLRLQFKKGEIDITDILIKITNIVREDNFVKLSKEKIRIEEEFHNAEKLIKENIRSNPYEIKIIQKIGINSRENQTQYCELLNHFPKDSIEEQYLYHGCYLYGDLNRQCNLTLHQSSKHLLNAYYLTNNSFYSCFDGNLNYGPLNINDTCYISYCKVFYNKEYLDDLLPVPKKSAHGILLNKGAIRCYIGDSNNNFLPLDSSNSFIQNPFAVEYIINDLKQILPLFVFKVTRVDYFIIWRNDDVDSDDNLRYINELSNDRNVNVYGCKSDTEALSLIRRKKNNKIKLITNQCSSLIDLSRNIIGSNFLCLIYSNSMNEMNAILNRENILVTTNEGMFDNFARLDLEDSAYLNFIQELQNHHNVVFNINNNEMLRFPNFVEQVPFDPNITTSNSIV